MQSSTTNQLICLKHLLVSEWSLILISNSIEQLNVFPSSIKYAELLYTVSPFRSSIFSIKSPFLLWISFQFKIYKILLLKAYAKNLKISVNYLFFICFLEWHFGGHLIAEFLTRACKWEEPCWFLFILNFNKAPN